MLTVSVAELIRSGVSQHRVASSSPDAAQQTGQSAASPGAAQQTGQSAANNLLITFCCATAVLSRHSVLMLQLERYVSFDGAALTGIDLSKCVQTQGDSCLLQEPLVSLPTSHS